MRVHVRVRVCQTDQAARCDILRQRSRQTIERQGKQLQGERRRPWKKPAGSDPLSWLSAAVRAEQMGRWSSGTLPLSRLVSSVTLTSAALLDRLGKEPLK